ncbi:hypothetical protein [Pseudonocardia adelaidensis]|uniref:Uncharacterized protein n=1 Tax=Pseudonocardia adelaidensis TaxID=648754 RepID=A0ABP9NRM6_9PSEU
MSRRRWRHRCHAKRTDGEPCGGWSISGGFVCTSHGGSSPAVRRAAAVRLAEDSLRRQFRAAQARLERERLAWLAARIVFAAEQLGEDPRRLAREARPWIAGGVLPPFDIDEWPPGLRAEDEPRLRVDRRYGRRPRAAS